MMSCWDVNGEVKIRCFFAAWSTSESRASRKRFRVNALLSSIMSGALAAAPPLVSVGASSCRQTSAYRSKCSAQATHVIYSPCIFVIILIQ